MNTSLIRRTLDPVVAAIAATMLCALMAKAQIVVLPSSNDTPRNRFRLSIYHSERLSPDIITEDGTFKRPVVDAALVEKVERVRSQIPISAPSYYMIPGSSQ